MNKFMQFELSKKDLKVKDLLAGDFLEMEMYAISDAKPNNNKSHFTLEAMQDALESFKNKPILGYFNTSIGPMGDFEAHNDNGLHYDAQLEELYFDYNSADSEIPLGTIRESDNVEIVFDEKTNLNWIKFNCCLWCKYNYKAIKSLLKSRKGTSKISVEVEVTESHMEDDIEVIDKFNFLGCTILGEAVHEGIEGAHLSVLDFVEDALFAKKQQCLNFAYSALDNYNMNTNVEIPADANALEQDSNINFKEESPEVDRLINEEGGEQIMPLTYNQKRELLQKALEHDCCCYSWIVDLDDSYCYFQDCEMTYRAPYSIDLEQEENVATISFEEKERVICSWAVYASKYAETVDPNEEPAQEQVIETPEEGVAAATESIQAPEIQTEPGDLGDANEVVAEEMQMAEVQQEIVDGEPDVTSEVSEGPAGEEAQVVAEGADKPEANVEQPNDDAKEEIFAEENEACGDKKEEEEEVCPDCGKNPCVCESKECHSEKTVELNGESVDIDGLLVKYNELKDQFDTLTQTVKEGQAKDLAEFGANFINSDGVVDEEAKKDYVDQISAKCLAYELESEEEVTKFAKSLLAMYYYEKQNAKEETTEFSVSIETVKTQKATSSLKEKINALNHLD